MWILNVTTSKTPSADENHVTESKAPQQLWNEARGEIVLFHFQS